jgi:hypothetical protein
VDQEFASSTLKVSAGVVKYGMAKNGSSSFKDE